MSAPTDILTIVCLLPEMLGTNGDAANARVLAQRARWAGVEADVVPVRDRADLPARVDMVVIGSGTDADLVPARTVLRTLVDELRVWLASGVPILAVGTGWELLSAGIELADGSVVDGLGLIPGRASARTARATGDLAVITKQGRLIGFENHARDFLGAEASALGRVLAGVGNGHGTEGMRVGDLVGTHLHGPVLATNPFLADQLLTGALARHGLTYTVGARALEVDDIAQAARNQIAVRLGLETE